MEKIDLDEVFKLLTWIYEEKMPFNKMLGITIDEMSLNKAVIGFKMKEELVGNPHMKILHGGVISAVLDFTGGVMAQLGVIDQMIDATAAELEKRLLNMGTIDMRVDFIRPGKGDSFKATGELLRLGKNVAVTRSLLHNNEDLLIASATTTYSLR